MTIVIMSNGLGTSENLFRIKYFYAIPTYVIATTFFRMLQSLKILKGIQIIEINQIDIKEYPLMDQNNYIVNE